VSTAASLMPAALIAVIAFAANLWIEAGDTASRFHNLLLFIGDWIAPFCATAVIDWNDNEKNYDPSFLHSALKLQNLQMG